MATENSNGSKKLVKPPNGTIPVTVTAKDVAAATGLSASTIYEFAKAGKLSHYKIGGSYYFTWESIEKFFKAHWVEASETEEEPQPGQPTLLVE